MGFHGFFVVVLCVQMMSLCELRMVRGFLVITSLAVLRRFSVVLGRLFVVIRGFGMMVVSVGH
ncbi:MAG: hypothetical protein ACLPX9_20805 [Rhodomicrobium sp.]